MKSHLHTHRITDDSSIKLLQDNSSSDKLVTLRTNWKWSWDFQLIVVHEKSLEVIILVLTTRVKVAKTENHPLIFNSSENWCYRISQHSVNCRNKSLSSMKINLPEPNSHGFYQSPTYLGKGNTQIQHALGFFVSPKRGKKGWETL